MATSTNTQLKIGENMLLVKTSNGGVEQFPYTFGDLRRDNPQTSFPKKIGDAILASYGIYHVMPEAQPEYDNLVQVLVRDAEPHNNETAVNEDGETYRTGRWVIGYTVENKPQDQAEANVRNNRDSLLTDTDWMALSDVTMSTEMSAYRQALRDVTSQAGFPYNITWPTKP
jgi:hypothetical protein